MKQDNSILSQFRHRMGSTYQEALTESTLALRHFQTRWPDVSYLPEGAYFSFILSSQVNRLPSNLTEQIVLVPLDGEVLASQLMLDRRYEQAFPFLQYAHKISAC
jgi:hypothetical protein